MFGFALENLAPRNALAAPITDGRIAGFKFGGRAARVRPGTCIDRPSAARALMCQVQDFCTPRRRGCRATTWRLPPGGVPPSASASECSVDCSGMGHMRTKTPMGVRLLPSSSSSVGPPWKGAWEAKFWVNSILWGYRTKDQSWIQTRWPPPGHGFDDDFLLAGRWSAGARQQAGERWRCCVRAASDARSKLPTINHLLRDRRRKGHSIWTWEPPDPPAGRFIDRSIDLTSGPAAAGCCLEKRPPVLGRSRSTGCPCVPVSTVDTVARFDRRHGLRD